MGEACTSIWSGKTVVQLEDDFLDEMRDVAIPGPVYGDCPLMGVCFVDVVGRVFNVREGGCVVAVDDGTVD